jgi:hypothetical protein
MFEHGSFNLDFVTLKFWKYAWFSPGIFHFPISNITLLLRTHTMTKVDATQSHDYGAPLKYMSVYLFRISVTLVMLYTESYGFFIWV